MRSFTLGLVLVAVLVPAIHTQAAGPDTASKAREIAQVLKKSGQLKDYRVGVKYEDGVAWLMGSVTDAKQKRIAEKLVKNCDGVTHVVSRIVVDETTAEAPAPNASNLRVASAPAQAGSQVRKAHQQSGPQQKPAARRPNPRQVPANRIARNNMPVPYAPAGSAQAGRNVQFAAYNNQQAQYCPPGSGMAGGAPMMSQGGPAPMMPQGPGAMGQAVNYDNPQMPGYAWPSYAASPNYAGLTYPRQYSASAWPYIGPFYPYPQVPLGWRKVTLEWDDGWWFLDFKDCKHCK